MEKSYFDGGLLQLIGWKILGGLLTVATLGLGYPWAVCMIHDWETKHTVINGQRLHFNGTAMQLFGSWIKWWFLSLITLGIYALWIPIKTKKWITKHTEFMAAYANPGQPVQIQASEAIVSEQPAAQILASKTELPARSDETDMYTPFFVSGIIVSILGLVFSFSALWGFGVVAVGVALLSVSYYYA